MNDRPGWKADVNKEIERYGAKVVSQYVVLGPYDFVTILEAADNATVARVSAELGSRGTVQIMSLPAITIEGFTQGFK